MFENAQQFRIQSTKYAYEDQILWEEPQNSHNFDGIYEILLVFQPLDIKLQTNHFGKAHLINPQNLNYYWI